MIRFNGPLRLAVAVLFVSLGIGLAGTASAVVPRSAGAKSKCDPRYPYDPPHFSHRVLKINHSWADSHTGMARSDARELVKVVWKKLYKRCHHKPLTEHQLQYRIDGNLRQIADDSGFIPAARSPTGLHAKGLLQMIDPVFGHWHVPGYKRVYHPLDDLLAAINIQLNARTVVSVVDNGYVYPHNVLNGRHHGWGFHGGDNPYKPFH